MSSHHDKIVELAKRLEEWDYKVDRLEHRLKGLPEEIKAAADKKYQKLLDVRNKLKEKEEALISATEHAIDDVEHSIEEVFDTFKLLFEDVEVHIEVEGT